MPATANLQRMHALLPPPTCMPCCHHPHPPAPCPPQVEQLVLAKLEELAVSGFTSTAIEAAINTIEFSLRENNTGSFPRGLSLMLRAVGAWIYDQDPFQPIQWEVRGTALQHTGRAEMAAGLPGWSYPHWTRCLGACLCLHRCVWHVYCCLSAVHGSMGRLAACCAEHRTQGTALYVLQPVQLPSCSLAHIPCALDVACT
jgi:hypothetical protein